MLTTMVSALNAAATTSLKKQWATATPPITSMYATNAATLLNQLLILTKENKMGIVIIIFLNGVIMGIRVYCKRRDGEQAAFNVLGGFILAVFYLFFAMALTGTNSNEYYAYTPTEIELSAIDGKSIALDGAKIYYIGDNEIRSINTKYANIKHSDTPHAIYYKYCGYNQENWFRWIYTFPDGKDYVEFYIPDGSISTTYHFGGN